MVRNVVPGLIPETGTSYGNGTVIVPIARAMSESDVSKVQVRGGITFPVHRVRTAARRLRTALKLFAPALPRKAKNWRKAIRDLAQTILAPVASELNKQRLIVVAHRAGLDLAGWAEGDIFAY